MSQADRARRAGIRAERRCEKVAFDRAAAKQMMAEADAFMMGDDEPEFDQPAQAAPAPARRPQGME